MKTFELITVPTDKRLYEKAKRVKNHQSAETYEIVQKLKASLIHYRGVGFAANQFGVNRRIIVAYHEGLNEIFEFINPRIISASKSTNDMYWDKEGCYSHPGIIAEVERYRSIQLLCYQLKYPNEVRLNVSGLISRVIQHEIDHLDGKLMTDLGPHVRDIFLDDQGQRRLFEANAREAERGPRDFVVE